MSDSPFSITAPPERYRQRRARLAGELDRPIVIFAGEARGRQYATNTYPFRAGSTYLYFGGPAIPGAAWLIEPGKDDASTLFRPEAGVEEAVWVGESPSDDVLASVAGVDKSALKAPDSLGSRLSGRPASFLAPPCPQTLGWASSLELMAPNERELLAIIGQRLIKDEYEVAAMMRAADASIDAHLAAMWTAEPDVPEAEVAAAFYAMIVANRCRPSFTANVTTRGEVLHNDAYPGTLEAGRLLLLDGGAEEPGGYACDITRTYPVTGEFTAIQRQLHDTVYRALGAATAACVPGKRYRDVHDISARAICEGLVEAELLNGDPAELAERRAHTLFYTHGVGHLIGLDVHDMEDFGDLAGYAPGRTRRTAFGDKYLRLDRDLEPGMTVTIEPGIYLVPAIWQQDALIRPFRDVVNRQKVDALLADEFGGIRIEDTILVRADGEPEVLTAELPADADAVTATMLDDGE